MPQQTKGHRNEGLDLLRVLCTLYIVGFWHLLGFASPLIPYNIPLTSILTNLVLATFVFLSAYLLGTKNITLTATELRRFYTSRFVRIYPLYLLALGIFYVTGIAKLSVVAKAAVFLSMLWGPPPLTLWFITLIMLFYLLAPFARWINQNFSPIYYWTAMLLFLVALGEYYLFTKLPDLRLLLYFPAFAAGIFVAHYPSLVEKLRVVSYLPALALSIALLFIDSGSRALSTALQIPFVTVGAYGLFVLSKRTSLHSNITKRIVSYLSYASFAVYLFHRPIYETFSSRFLPESRTWQFVFLYGVCFTTAWIVAYIVQSIYDMLLNRITKRETLS